ncbi:hypothetical protein AB433_15450 [Croceicoccus naphthovorans]|uniref:Uncharacterized protein n=1 Tax=Croceicoccus naphthovorans TaxID=1348774 RepID=A0A0G3XKX3_9SPHN|nr:hypothetical protein AB433_15450 [Croceicoccus naphthovorans]
MPGIAIQEVASRAGSASASGVGGAGLAEISAIHPDGTSRDDCHHASSTAIRRTVSARSSIDRQGLRRL